MDCCSHNPQTQENSVDTAQALPADSVNAPAPLEDGRRACRDCGRSSRAVTRKTMLLMLKPEHFDSVGEGEYRFCHNPECEIVYFTEGAGAVFTKDTLRVRVGLKEKEDPIPLCYCFGFDEADARAEIARTGRSAIPQRISAFIRQGMCACPTRNPSGTCCLGDVNKVIARLMRNGAANVEKVRKK